MGLVATRCHSAPSGGECDQRVKPTSVVEWTPDEGSTTENTSWVVCGHSGVVHMHTRSSVVTGATMPGEPVEGRGVCEDQLLTGTTVAPDPRTLRVGGSFLHHRTWCSPSDHVVPQPHKREEDVLLNPAPDC